MALKAVKKTSKAEARSQKLAAAMPEVRALCEKHGRPIVMSCVTRIAQYEQIAAKAESLRRQAAALEKKLVPESDAARNSIGST
jgi:3-phosphoglycerate kinase